MNQSKKIIETLKTIPEGNTALDKEIRVLFLQKSPVSQDLTLSYYIPTYTTLIDDALKLVPTGWEWSLTNSECMVWNPLVISNYSGVPEQKVCVKAGTTELAICAACLTAFDKYIK